MQSLPSRLRAVSGMGALLVCGCGSGATEPKPEYSPGPPVTLVVIARPPVSDTIAATPILGIVVEARDSAGQPAPGAIVQFLGLPGPGNSPLATMLVRAASSATYQAHESITTDLLGQVVVHVEFATVAGPGHIQIAIADAGLAVDLGFTIEPGDLVSLGVAPRDTAAHPGASIQLRVTPSDRFGNPRTDRVTWQKLWTPAGAAVDPLTGVVTVTAVSRDTVIVNMGALRDTGFVSVVPHGTYVAVSRNELILSDLDGTGRRVL
jgi:hypothetical protein